jgi:hypothetical protein
MKDNHKAVFGIYDNRITVEAGVDRLKSEGFSSQDISVLMPDREGSQAFAHEKAPISPMFFSSLWMGAIQNLLINFRQ